MALDPDDPTLLNNRGYFLYKTGRHDAAMRDFEKALRMKDGYAAAQINLDCVKNWKNAASFLQASGKP